MEIVSQLIEKNRRKHALSFRGIIEVKHNIPGRIRYFIPSLINKDKDIKKLEKVIRDFNKVKSIEGSAISGSLIINYSDMDPSLITGVLIHVLNLNEEIEKPVLGKVYKELASLFSSLNRGLYEETKGFLDLHSVITLSLGFMGIRSLLRKPRIAPGAWTLLWWFYTSSMGLNSNGGK